VSHCNVKINIKSEKRFVEGGSLLSFVRVMLLSDCCVREKCWVQETSGIVRSSAGCEDQPCSWVHREGREEEKEREICKIRVQIELYVFI